MTSALHPDATVIDLAEITDDGDTPVLLPFRGLPKIVTPPACPACDGLGFKRFWDADTRWHHERCMACRGVSTEGAFVLEIVTPRFRHEVSSFQTARVDRGLEELARLAARLVGRKCLNEPCVEVRLVYRAWDREWRSPEGDAAEVISVVRVARLLTARR